MSDFSLLTEYTFPCKLVVKENVALDQDNGLPPTVEPRLSRHWLSGLFDYPDFFSGPVFFMNINDLRC